MLYSHVQSNKCDRRSIYCNPFFVTFVAHYKIWHEDRGNGGKVHRYILTYVHTSIYKHFIDKLRGDCDDDDDDYEYQRKRRAKKASTEEAPIKTAKKHFLLCVSQPTTNSIDGEAKPLKYQPNGT